MNALIQLNSLPETREQQKTFIHAAVEELINGDYNIMQYYVKAKLMLDTLDKINKSKRIKPLILEEAQRYNNQSLNGCTIQVVTKREYNFDNCNHAEYNRLKKLQAETEQSLKAIENMLKSLVSPVADPESGELIYPPVVTENEYVKIT